MKKAGSSPFQVGDQVEVTYTIEEVFPCEAGPECDCDGTRVKVQWWHPSKGRYQMREMGTKGLKLVGKKP